mgnify:CR=1 FL=1
MGVVGVVKRFVHFLTEGDETVCPTFLPTEVGIVGIELELYLVLQAIEHCMKHIGIFGEETGIYTYVINHRLFERTIQKMVSGGKVIWVHVSSF